MSTIRGRGGPAILLAAAITAVVGFTVATRAAERDSPRGRPAQAAPPAPGAAGASQTPRVAAVATAPQPVPKNLRPPLTKASRQLPAIYANRCHLGKGVVRIPRCVFGNPRGRVTIVLLGDSHAAQWFPPLDRIARRRRYRLVSLTHSHCAAAIVRVWSAGYVRSCDQWRRAALRRIARERPDLVVVTSIRTYGIADASGALVTDPATTATLWRRGYDALMARLHRSARKIALITDSKMSTDIPSCLAQHLDDATACASPRDISIDPAYARVERSIAADDDVALVATTRWTCPGDPCPAIIGNILLWRDTHHLTPVMTTSLAPRLATAFAAILRS